MDYIFPRCYKSICILRLFVETCVLLARDSINCAVGRIVVAECDIKDDAIVRHAMKVLCLSKQNLTILNGGFSRSCCIIAFLLTTECLGCCVATNLHGELPEVLIVCNPQAIGVVG